MGQGQGLDFRKLPPWGSQLWRTPLEARCPAIFASVEQLMQEAWSPACGRTGLAAAGNTRWCPRRTSDSGAGGLTPSGFRIPSSHEGSCAENREDGVTGTRKGCRFPWDSSHLPSLQTSCEGLMEVTVGSETLADPLCPCSDPRERGRRRGIWASFDAGVQPTLPLEWGPARAPEEQRAPSLSPPGPGTAPWNPPTRPPHGRSQARTAARPLEALFSLGLWALGSFFSRFLQSSVG